MQDRLPMHPISHGLAFSEGWWMIEPEEYQISSDQLLANLEEMLRMIDSHVIRIKQMLASPMITHYQDKALFYALNLMLRERKELIEERERVLLQNLSEELWENAS